MRQFHSDGRPGRLVIMYLLLLGLLLLFSNPVSKPTYFTSHISHLHYFTVSISRFVYLLTFDFVDMNHWWCQGRHIQLTFKKPERLFVLVVVYDPVCSLSLNTSFSV